MFVLINFNDIERPMLNQNNKHKDNVLVKNSYVLSENTSPKEGRVFDYLNKVKDGILFLCSHTLVGESLYH